MENAGQKLHVLLVLYMGNLKMLSYNLKEPGLWRKSEL